MPKELLTFRNIFILVKIDNVSLLGLIFFSVLIGKVSPLLLIKFGK